MKKGKKKMKKRWDKSRWKS